MTIDESFTRFPVLTTKRLHLRQILPTDAEAFFANFSDEKAMKFYGHEPHRSLKDSPPPRQRGLSPTLPTRFALPLPPA